MTDGFATYCHVLHFTCLGFDDKQVWCLGPILDKVIQLLILSVYGNKLQICSSVCSVVKIENWNFQLCQKQLSHSYSKCHNPFKILKSKEMFQMFNILEL